MSSYDFTKLYWKYDVGTGIFYSKIRDFVVLCANSKGNTELVTDSLGCFHTVYTPDPEQIPYIGFHSECVLKDDKIALDYNCSVCGGLSLEQAKQLIKEIEMAIAIVLVNLEASK